MMILVYYFFFGLLSSTNGQAQPNLTLSDTYVDRFMTVIITCRTGPISDSVDIFRNGTSVYRCNHPSVPCDNLLSIDEYDVVQNASAGTTIMTIDKANISRDTGSWACQYGASPMSQAVSITVGSPPNISITEGPEAVSIQTSCTFPAVIVNVTCSLNGTSLSFTYRVSINGSTCTDPNEAALTVIISLNPTQSVTGPGLLTVSVFNGIHRAFQTGTRLYTFLPVTTTTTTSNKTDELKLGLGLGLGLGIPCVITFIVVGIFIYKGSLSRSNIGKGILTGLLIASVIGIIVVYLLFDKLKPELTGQRNKIKDAGQIAIHAGNQNKVKSETATKKTYGKSQPLQPVAVVTGDIPKPHAQPPPPENIDIKDSNQRGIPAFFNDKQDLPTETPPSNKLPPLEDTPKEPKKKRKKKIKIKGQIKEGNPKEEIVELTSKRTLPEILVDQYYGN